MTRSQRLSRYCVVLEKLQPGGWSAEVRRDGVLLGTGTHSGAVHTGSERPLRGMEYHNAAVKIALRRALCQARFTRLVLLSRYRVVDTWNGGTEIPRVRFTSETIGSDGREACEAWIHRNTPFSVHEATTNQGYKIERIGGAL